MPLHLADHWVWDHWVLPDGDRYHLFFLRASRALLDPERRHSRAAIGHAVSDDLRSWELVADALVAADSPAFDDRACWTGSAVHLPGGGIRLFYTGSSRADDGVVQRITWADSADGITFHRTEVPPVEPDARWYETEDSYDWHDVAWRDPFVFRHDDGLWHMLFTARARAGRPSARGVVGHAVSGDLDTWEVLPPLTEPGSGFGQMEVCQQHTIDGQNYLVFSCKPEHVAPGHVAPGAGGPPTAGIWLAHGESPLGPWDVAGARPIAQDELYAGQLVRDAGGAWFLTAFLDEIDGAFRGEVADLVPFEDVFG
ncbi:MAG: glycosyl hydrolase family 32 [Cellulomonadaceae bacterium]